MEPNPSGQIISSANAGGPDSTESPSAVNKSTPSSTQNTPDDKIAGLNANGTITLSSKPKNQAEVELYRVMQRASLLMYYDTLLEMGGDDMQQLCEAGEVEFLEIMSLVGMATKPLHVRRFQKALNEWLKCPAMFQIPVKPEKPGPVVDNHPFVKCPNFSLVSSITPPPCLSTPASYRSPHSASSRSSSKQVEASSSPQVYSPSCASVSASPSVSPSPSPVSPIQAVPYLVKSQIEKITVTARCLVETLPQFEPKLVNTKKKQSGSVEDVLSMAEDDPRRMDLIRKYSAIYGRFDSKRKQEKPLNLHELSVNEAAAQLCNLVPALLTRREDLFPLARQVVRESGYRYSKGHSKSSKALTEDRMKRYRTGSKSTYSEKNSYPEPHQNQVLLRNSVNDSQELSDRKTCNVAYEACVLRGRKPKDPLRCDSKQATNQNKDSLSTPKSSCRTRWTKTGAGYGHNNSSCPDTDDTDSHHSLSLSNYSQEGDPQIDDIEEEKYAWSKNEMQISPGSPPEESWTKKMGPHQETPNSLYNYCKNQPSDYSQAQVLATTGGRASAASDPASIPSSLNEDKIQIKTEYNYS